MSPRSVAILSICFVLLGHQPVIAADLPEITIYRTAACKCCGRWVDHLSENGFPVKVEQVTDLKKVEPRRKVPPKLLACHTAVIDGYIVEGHVPAADIKRLLIERPQVTGVAVPGMPRGSPGMESIQKDPYNVLTFDRFGKTEVYAKY